MAKFVQKMKNVKTVSHCQPVKGSGGLQKKAVEASLTHRPETGRYDFVMDGKLVFSGPFNMAIAKAEACNIRWDTEPKLEWKTIKT